MLTSNLRETSKPGTFPDKHMNQFLSAWDNDGAIHSMSAWYRANANFDLNVDKMIQSPGLFVLAPDDAFSPRQIGLDSLEFLARAELLGLAQGTHWVIQEQPEKIGRILIDSFRRNSSPGRDLAGQNLVE